MSVPPEDMTEAELLERAHVRGRVAAQGHRAHLRDRLEGAAVTALAPDVESRLDAIRAADALMAAHPGAVIVPAELRGDRVGLWAHVPGAWRLGDADEVRAWLEAEAPAAAAAQRRP